MEKLISKKKPFFPLGKQLSSFLKRYDRWIQTPISYEDLLRFSGSVAVYDEKDQDTLWVRVFYTDSERTDIDFNLKKIYTLLHSDGNEMALPFLNVDAIDYCTFGNSKPFRVKIRNILNDNFTYFYVKKTDASRVYGLEFEHMLSPYNLNYLVDEKSLVEEHIAGIPGDIFFKEHLHTITAAQKNQIAKEYVKFNERCMVRLLGDMRAYNYVVIPIHDFDQVIFRIRAIDFDQQAFEGKFNVYRPQFFKENQPLMKIIQENLQKDSIIQYKIEERSIMARRIISSENRLLLLLEAMEDQQVSLTENLKKLREEIYRYTQDPSFLASESMGQVMRSSFNFIRRHYESVNMSNLF
ncbi:MAG: hypothetical protein ACPGC5_06275 [Flavobacteriaceae bacterium]